MKKVLVVEDSKIARNTIESYIAQSENYVLAASFENAANAEIACIKAGIDVVLMDVCTADGESGLVTAAKIKKHNPDIRIIIMTSMPEYSFIEKAKAAGCDSFWYKEFGDAELLDVMDRTMRGESVYPSETPAVSIGDASSEDLTERELEVLRQIALGCKYGEIAESLFITTNTVKYYIKKLLLKTGYKSTLALIVDVVDKKLVLPRF